jgi:hypothetical protein
MSFISLELCTIFAPCSLFQWLDSVLLDRFVPEFLCGPVLNKRFFLHTSVLRSTFPFFRELCEIARCIDPILGSES